MLVWISLSIFFYFFQTDIIDNVDSWFISFKDYFETHFGQGWILYDIHVYQRYIENSISRKLDIYKYLIVTSER